MSVTSPHSPPGDFRLRLQSELLRRCKTNPRYSLRSFARFLQVEPSALSKLLHGKRGVSERMLHHLGGRLGMGPGEMAEYRVHRRQRSDVATQSEAYRRLTLDTFEVIAHWYHYAILEFSQVQGFEPDARAVARALGLTVAEVNAAVERLVRLGMLEITAGGKWIDRSGSITTVGTAYTATAFRQLQRQVLEQALQALEEVPIERRDQSSLTMAINPELLDEARDRIRSFRRRLCAFLQSRPPMQEVYTLSVSLFPLLKEKPDDQPRR